VSPCELDCYISCSLAKSPFRNIAHTFWRGVLLYQNRLPPIIDSWSNQPAVLDDAYSKKSPIPLELVDSWLVFDAVLEARFENTPGLNRIKNKFYQLQDAQSGESIQRAQEFKTIFRPGRRLVKLPLLGKSMSSTEQRPFLGKSLTDFTTRPKIDSRMMISVTISHDMHVRILQQWKTVEDLTAAL
jgi:hypothetical protein